MIGLLCIVSLLFIGCGGAAQEVEEEAATTAPVATEAPATEAPATSAATEEPAAQATPEPAKEEEQAQTQQEQQEEGKADEPADQMEQEYSPELLAIAAELANGPGAIFVGDLSQLPRSCAHAGGGRRGRQCSP